MTLLKTMRIALLAAAILSLPFLWLSVRLFLCLSSMSVSLPLCLIYWASFIFCLAHTCTNTPTHTLTHTLAHTNTHTETHTHKQLMVIWAVYRPTDKLPCRLHTTNSHESFLSLCVCCFVVAVNKLLCHLHMTNSDELFLCVHVVVYFFAIFTQQIQIFLCVLLL